ncbi:MAG: hypothetical protein LBD31_04660 [Treponema sp.]|nr:hypothetical protein [Treponema sp.]
MALLSGEYPATLDEKGRISIPSRFREGIPANVLVLTKGILAVHHCVWACIPENLERMRNNLGASAAPLPFLKNDIVTRWQRFSNFDVDVDRAGRIMVPQKLRDFAGLSKECIVTSDGIRIEIWDARRYEEYERHIDEQISGVLEEMGPLNLY